MAQKVKVIKPELAAATLASPTPTATVPVEVVKTTEGPVTFWQKAAGYYKAIIAFLGMALIVLNQVAPFFGTGETQHTVTIVIAVVTTVLAFMKENQHWIPDNTLGS